MRHGAAALADLALLRIAARVLPRIDRSQLRRSGSEARGGPGGDPIVVVMGWSDGAAILWSYVVLPLPDVVD
jgi:hypothetical protein